MKEIHCPLPADDAHTPELAIQLIRHDTRENLYFFKNGRQHLRFRGSASQMTIYTSDLKEVDDCIVIHNHPQGSSFSLSDIENMIELNFKEFVLVTPDYIYRIIRAGKAWNIDCKSEYVKIQLEVCQALAKDLMDKMITRNEMSLYDADIEIIHYLWASFFQINGVRYGREKHKT